MVVNDARVVYQDPVASTKKPAAAGDQKFVLRLPKDFHTALRHVAIDRGVSLNTLIAEVLQAWWSKQPEQARYSGTNQRRR
jgi:predicted HicB family RNase H-like nuclease